MARPHSASEKISLKDIHSTSKTIKKEKSNSKKCSKNGVPTPENSTPKKYKTFTKEARWAVIKSLMKELGFSLRGKKNGWPDLLLEQIKKLPVDVFSEALTKVLLRHVTCFVRTVEGLKKWRRRVREWITNHDKPETRGGPLLIGDEEGLFKSKLKALLRGLPEKSFILVKTSGLEILREIHDNSEKADEPFRNKFSKHFWYSFLERNKDIKKIYDKLPPSRKRKSHTKEMKQVMNGGFANKSPSNEDLEDQRSNSDKNSSQMEEENFDSHEPVLLETVNFDCYQNKYFKKLMMDSDKNKKSGESSFDPFYGTIMTY